MDKIASPNELAAELRRLLAYAGSEKPSREKLASELRELAERVASNELKPQDLKRGLVIEEKDHPEYGEWRVLGPAKGVPGMWEIRNRRGDKVLDEGELRFWRKVAGVRAAAGNPLGVDNATERLIDEALDLAAKAVKRLDSIVDDAALYGMAKQDMQTLWKLVREAEINLKAAQNVIERG